VGKAVYAVIVVTVVFTRFGLRKSVHGVVIGVGEGRYVEFFGEQY
jgi:hypothetical protein